MVELARARVRAAALHGDPLAVEAAGRAYAVAVHRALLARVGHILAAMLRPAWGSIRGQRARLGSVADLDL
jgi:hypothetical protein